MKRITAIIAVAMMFSGVASAWEISPGLSFDLGGETYRIAGFSVASTDTFGLAVGADALTFGAEVSADLADGVDAGAKALKHTATVGVGPDGLRGGLGHE